MSYNRWMPQEYQSGGELYHHGVKGMKWKNKKGVQDQAQSGMTGMGAGAISNWDSVSGLKNMTSTMSFNTKSRIAYENSRPEWQKKWRRSEARKKLKDILSLIKGKKKSHGDRPRSRKRNVTGGGKGVKLRGSATK